MSDSPPPKQQGPNWSLSDDGKTVTVIFPSTPPVALRMDAEEVDNMLEKLAEFREQMILDHPTDYPPGQVSMFVPDPPWRSESDIMEGYPLLHILHPGFGWLHFAFPRHKAAKLAGFLQAQAKAPHEEPSGDAIRGIATT